MTHLISANKMYIAAIYEAIADTSDTVCRYEERYYS
jgi:hypothetical protein